ncbi:MAG: FCD domain-containing protein [Deltaproteobacteria bacterium]|nr:FCD domain-containing protein [Deltaproteobacteria bacterium]
MSIKSHEDILSAVEKRDPELAKKTMRDHLTTVEQEALRDGRKG